MICLIFAAALYLIPGVFPLQIAPASTTIAVPLVGSANIAAAQATLSWTSGLALDSIRPNARWSIITNPEYCSGRCLLFAGFDVDGIPEQGAIAIAYFRTPNRTQCDMVSLGIQVIGVQVGDNVEGIYSGVPTRPLVLCTVRR